MEKDVAALLDTPEIKDLRLKRHLKNLEDPVYKEGFNAENHFAPPYPKNPYVFPEETSHKLTVLAVKDVLSDEELKELVRLRTELEASEWSRWSDGNYHKHCANPE